MAEVLFGSPSLRINVAKALQQLPFHGSRAQRLQYIADVRKRLELDYLLRRNHRQMAVGAEQYRSIPYFKFPMNRAPGLGSPIHMPIETEHSGGLEIELTNLDEIEQNMEKAVEAYHARYETNDQIAERVSHVTEDKRADMAKLLERLKKLRTQKK